MGFGWIWVVELLFVGCVGCADCRICGIGHFIRIIWERKLDILAGWEIVSDCGVVF